MSYSTNTQLTKVQSEEETNRYTRRSILRSEKMYGTGFQSPGSLAAVEAFCRRLEMRPGMNILDIGSGLGGTCFYFAERFAASVTGLDVAQAMVEISNERKQEKKLERVTFLEGDIRSYPLAASSFDLAWTRDCILYIPEKLGVWQQVYRALKPGGQLFITDFCRGAGELSREFREYTDDCHYYLQTLDHYAATLQEAGFALKASEDITEEFIASLQQEKEALVAQRAEFLSEFDEADYQYLVGRWEKKLKFSRQGDLRWGLFIAQKS